MSKASSTLVPFGSEESASIFLLISPICSPYSPVPDYIKSTVETAMKIHQVESDGDILAFLTGQVWIDALLFTLQCFVKLPQSPAFFSCACFNLIKDDKYFCIDGSRIRPVQKTFRECNCGLDLTKLVMDDSFSHLMLYAFSLVTKWKSVWGFGASHNYKADSESPLIMEANGIYIC